MIYKILFLFFIATSIIHSYTIKELNNPTSAVFDITKDPVFATNSIPKIMLEVEKIKVEIDKVTVNFPREVTESNCGTDMFSNVYCPQELAPADTYWDYDDGHSEEVKTSNTSSAAKVTEYYGCNYAATGHTQTHNDTYPCNYSASASSGSPYCPPYHNHRKLWKGPYWYDGLIVGGYLLIEAGWHCIYDWYDESLQDEIPASGGGTTYSCPNGGTLSGTTCIKTCGSTYTTTTYSCPNGGSLSGTTCIKTCSRQVCPSGFEERSSYTAKATTGSPYCPPYHNHRKLWKGPYWYDGLIVGGYLLIEAGWHCIYDWYDESLQDEIPASGGGTTYSCPNGGTLSGTTCHKTACYTPANTSDYSYYNYLCKSELNEQREDYQPINKGGESSKNPTPPPNNCKRLGFTCNSNVRNPAWVDNQWKCSPYNCDSNKKCATAECRNGTAQAGGTKFSSSPLNATNFINVCNDLICDAAIFDKLGLCGADSKCPTAFGVYEENGNCFKDECPKGATKKTISSDETLCLIPQCPEGYIENPNGGCDAE